jgi:hypothetical protein
VIVHSRDFHEQLAQRQATMPDAEPDQLENLLQRRPHPRLSIVDQDLQHREPAEQLGAGCPGSRLALVTGLEVAIND